MRDRSSVAGGTQVEPIGESASKGESNRRLGWRGGRPRSRADRAVDVLLVGGGVAAARCARTLRRNGFAGSILLVGAEARVPYNRPPLSKEMLRDDLPRAARRRASGLVRAPPCRAPTLDATSNASTPPAARSRRRRVHPVRAPAHRDRRGGTAPPGARCRGSITLRTADDAARLRSAAVAAGQGAPVVVVGGGFIGLEVASSLASLGLRPTVVELAPRCGQGRWVSSWPCGRRSASPASGSISGSAHERSVRRRSRLDRRRATPRGVRGRGRGGPAPHRARRRGRHPVDDGVVVDEGQRSTIRPIWAAGDVARMDGRTRIEHWHAAREAGERAALSMLGRPVPRRPLRGSSPRSVGRRSTSSAPRRAGRRSVGSTAPDPSWPTFVPTGSSA